MRDAGVGRDPASIALLMFNLNDNVGIVRNVRSLAPVVDEIVIVDSSPPDTYQTLLESLADYDTTVCRAIPMGFVDPLRPFGVSKVSSEFVLLLDADEEPSERLKSDLRALTGCDAYVLPRFEKHLESYTYHLRLFRRSAVRYRGRSFDFPEVAGRIGWLGKSHRIVHMADYGNYLTNKSRAERYFTIENVERPFTHTYLGEALTLRMRERSFSLPFTTRPRKNPDSLLAPPVIQGIIDMEFLRDILLGKGRRAASFGRQYSIAKWRFLAALQEHERSHLLAIARELQRCGGLFEYLGLDDPTYLEHLTASFHWDRRGIDVYKSLLDYRYRLGRPAESVPAA